MIAKTCACLATETHHRACLRDLQVVCDANG